MLQNTDTFLKMKNCVFVFGFTFVLFLPFSLSDPIVSILNGKIKGIELKTEGCNTSYYAFWNIPYGKPPVGSLRFQSPHPAESWSGVRDGTKEGNSCVYLNLPDFYPDPGPQDEDCLYVSVYTPTLNSSAQLPVMFWIHGGGFRSGSGKFKFYGPQSIIDENVILVTFNYRLGPLGFLSSGDGAISGNAGLKDQVLALKWTKDNIRFFGGNPEKITIFGESAGGMAVGLHLVSERSKGLFRAAICQSGCTLSTTLNLDPKYFFYNYTKTLDPTIQKNLSTYQIRDILVNRPVEQLMRAGLNVEQHLFVPVFEIETDDAFITRPLYELVSKGKVNGKALLIGTTSEESINFIHKEDLMPTTISYDKNVSLLLPNQIKLADDSMGFEMAQQIKDIYLSGNETFQNNLDRFLEYFSDNLFVRASFKQAKLQSQYQDVYLYTFSYYGTTSETRGYLIKGAGKVGHFDDLSYLFHMTQYPLKTQRDLFTRRKMAKLWTNFAKYLNPTPEIADLLNNVKWPKVQPNLVQLINIDEQLNVEPYPTESKMSAWNTIWNKYVKEPFITF